MARAVGLSATLQSKLLIVGFMTLYLFGTHLPQFGDASFDPFPPSNVGFFALNLTHEFFDIFFREAKLCFDGFKRCVVLPSHHDDPVGILE